MYGRPSTPLQAGSTGSEVVALQRKLLAKGYLTAQAFAPAPSSSGLGYLVLIQKIAGSNPAGVTTKLQLRYSKAIVYFGNSR